MILFNVLKTIENGFTLICRAVFFKKFIRDQLNGGKKWRNKSCYFSVQTIIALSPDNVKVMLKTGNLWMVVCVFC